MKSIYKAITIKGIFRTKYPNLLKIPIVKSIEDTMNEVIKNNCSMARFGDGEIFIMRGGRRGVGFQLPNKELTIRLREVIRTNDKNILICVHDAYANMFDGRTQDEVKYWGKHLREYRIPLYKTMDKSKTYYNACVTRFYSVLENKKNCNDLFNQFKRIWDNRDVIIIEGEKTRIGVNNNLLSNCKSIKRILCPAENAFDKYDEIYNEVLKQDKSKLILISLGPTATVLAYDLNKQGYQAVDIGHIDIEYEWFLKKTTKRIPIKGKYVNEAEYRNPGEIENEDYYNQIISKIL